MTGRKGKPMINFDFADDNKQFGCIALLNKERGNTEQILNHLVGRFGDLDVFAKDEDELLLPLYSPGKGKNPPFSIEALEQALSEIVDLDAVSINFFCVNFEIPGHRYFGPKAKDIPRYWPRAAGITKRQYKDATIWYC